MRPLESGYPCYQTASADTQLTIAISSSGVFIFVTPIPISIRWIIIGIGSAVALTIVAAFSGVFFDIKIPENYAEYFESFIG